MRARVTASRNPGDEKRSGATYSSRSPPAAAASSAARLAAGSCWALTSATSPGARARRASTWSCMSETRGETTIASRSSSSAGSW